MIQENLLEQENIKYQLSQNLIMTLSRKKIMMMMNFIVTILKKKVMMKPRLWIVQVLLKNQFSKEQPHNFNN